LLRPASGQPAGRHGAEAESNLYNFYGVKNIIRQMK
jgi:hypothetical protein